MKIAVLGSGHIGAGLARAWAKKGHTVVFGARTPDDAELVALCNAIGANAEHVKAAFGDGGVKAWLAVEGHTPAAAVKQLADIVANLF